VTHARVERIPVAATRPLRQAVLRPFLELEQLADSEPPDAAAFGVPGGAGAPVAVGLIGPEGEPGAWRIRGMATAPEARGRGFGGSVLAALVAHAATHGAARVWCNARTAAMTLYAREGFEVVSEEWDEPRIGPHVRMSLSI
jgi:GNAT superfamily N-acetyltransferase